MTYLDISVLAAYYCPEPISDKAEKLILNAPRPAISPLTQVELVSAVARKAREKEFSKETANKILNRFQAHIDRNLFHWLPLEDHHYQKAFNWIAQFNTPLRTLDALHLAVAAASATHLLTADRQLARAARLFGLDVVFL